MVEMQVEGKVVGGGVNPPACKGPVFKIPIVPVSKVLGVVAQSPTRRSSTHDPVYRRAMADLDRALGIAEPMPVRPGWFSCKMCDIEDGVGSISAEGHGPTLGNPGQGLSRCEPLYVDRPKGSDKEGPLCVGHVSQATPGFYTYVKEARHMPWGVIINGVYLLQQERRFLERQEIAPRGEEIEAWAPINQVDMRDVWINGVPKIEGPFGEGVYLFLTIGDARRHCRRPKADEFLVRCSVYAGEVARVFGRSNRAWDSGVDSLDAGGLLVVRDPARVLIEAAIKFSPTPNLSMVQEE